MASGPIISWQIEAGNVETVTDFLFLGSKITVDGDCSQEIRRYMLLGITFFIFLKCPGNYITGQPQSKITKSACDFIGPRLFCLYGSLSP